MAVLLDGQTQARAQLGVSVVCPRHYKESIWMKDEQLYLRMSLVIEADDAFVLFRYKDHASLFHNYLNSQHKKINK